MDIIAELFTNDVFNNFYLQNKLQNKSSSILIEVA